MERSDLGLPPSRGAWRSLPCHQEAILLGMITASRTWDLPCRGSANLRFVVLEQLYVVPDQLFPDELLSHGLRELVDVNGGCMYAPKATDLVEVRRRHVPYPPTLIPDSLPDLLQEVLLYLRWRE